MFLDLFEVNTTDNSNCIVFLAGSGLDYERKKEYELKIQLISLPKLISTERSFTFVTNTVLFIYEAFNYETF